MGDTESPSAHGKQDAKSVSRRSRVNQPMDPALREIYRRVGASLKALRERAALSQKQVCGAIFGASSLQGEWSRWERGLILPNIATLHQIAVYFGVSLGALGLYEPMPKYSRADMVKVNQESKAEIQKTHKEKKQIEKQAKRELELAERLAERQARWAREKEARKARKLATKIQKVLDKSVA